ncbi:MAG: Crp/Fnr family transcriptional regulator [Aquabacterium sp.]|jgi:CRP/FNR family transcriptional regulator|nr:MAG: Crp/Fnr family transcriptional regulator [Aquabacterium sp.]
MNPVQPPPCLQCPLRDKAAFRSNSPQEIAFIQRFKRQHKRLEAGEALVREGARSELYTIYSGWAFRYKTLSDGRRQILNFLLPGDFVGLQDLGIEGAPHGVEALTAMEACQFTRDELWNLYREHPSLGFDVTWLAAHEEAHVDENLLSAGRRNAEERIAALMMTLFKRAVALGLAHDGRCDFPLTQQHIADAVGLSLVHTNKTMRKLYRMGLFELAEGRLSVPNPQALRRLADYWLVELPRRPLI